MLSLATTNLHPFVLPLITDTTMTTPPTPDLRYGMVLSRHSLWPHSFWSPSDDGAEPQTPHGVRLARARNSDSSASLALSRLTPNDLWEFNQCPAPARCLQSITARDAVGRLLDLNEDERAGTTFWDDPPDDFKSLTSELYAFEGEAISRVTNRDREGTRRAPSLERLRHDESLANGWRSAKQRLSGHEDEVEQAWWGYRYAKQTLADLPPWEPTDIDQATDQSFIASYGAPETHTAIQKLRRKLDKHRHLLREPFEETLDFDHVVAKTLKSMLTGKVPAAIKIPALRSTVQARLDFWNTMGESEAMAKYNTLAAPIASLWREQTRAEEERVEANKRSRKATVTAGSDVLTIASVD